MAVIARQKPAADAAPRWTARLRGRYAAVATAPSGLPVDPPFAQLACEDGATHLDGQCVRLEARDRRLTIHNEDGHSSIFLVLGVEPARGAVRRLRLLEIGTRAPDATDAAIRSGLARLVLLDALGEPSGARRRR